jgi:hypothetical protein
MLCMLLGSALNGVTVGAHTDVETVSAERAAIDWALAMVAPRFAALRCASLPFVPGAAAAVSQDPFWLGLHERS